LAALLTLVALLAEDVRMDNFLMATGNARRSNAPISHRLFSLYAAEGVNSFAATLLTAALPFYTSHRFGWGARENFAIAALQGLLYMCGALLAQRVSQRWGRERSLITLYAVMTVFATMVGIAASFAWAVAMVGLVVVETGLMAVSWPMIESLISGAGESSKLSKRLGLYNIVWAVIGALAVATSGVIIQRAPAWFFFAIVASSHFLAGALIFYRSRLAAVRFEDGNPAHLTVNVEADGASIDREKLNEVVARRNRLALWLSRIALPSTYVIIFSLAPALPSLHAIKQLSPAIATLVASIWLIARAITFIIAGNTTFWHKRPGLMLVASVTMLFAFMGIIIPGALTEMDLTQAIAAMAIAQIVLGFSIGTIYSASLYFGMAVSEGSTEHGGYHEALIGLGQILGPLTGATMQWICPGSIWPAAIGISGLVSLTAVIEAVIGIRYWQRYCSSALRRTKRSIKSGEF
jgi:MFS family permease